MQNLRKINETGRSMVEMLGVLAIIGVLSAGGVYGYGVAMKKHKANELLHQASMLATTISAQIQSKGELPQSIEDFGNGKYGTFNPPNEANAEQFTMQITGMDSAVCEQMEKMVGGMVRKAECNGTTLTLTYNNNLSSEKVAADYNDDSTGGKCEEAGYKWCGGLSTPACKKDCCVGYDSQCCDSETGDISSTESCTTKDGKTTTCSNGKCEFGTENCQDKDCCDSIGAKWIEDVYGNTGVCFDSKKGEHATCWYAGCQKCTDYKTALIASDAPIGVCYDAKTEKAKCNNYDCEVCTSQQVKEGMDVFCDGEWGSCSCMKFLYDINNNPCFQNLDKNKKCCSNVDNDGNCCYDNFDKNGKCCLYYYDETSNTCCETGNESDGCCSTMYSGIGLDSKGQCCQFYLDKNKKCCKDYDEVSNTCCETGNESDGCCSIRYGGSGLDSKGQCCQYYLDKNKKCCQDYYDEASNTCCQSYTESEACCKAMMYDSTAKLDKNGECCYGGHYDEANEACCMGPSDSEYCSTVF